jgi:hypothetical protein
VSGSRLIMTPAVHDAFVDAGTNRLDALLVDDAEESPVAQCQFDGIGIGRRSKNS